MKIIQKIIKDYIKNISINLFNFIFYHLILLNVIIYKINKHVHNLIFINIYA